MRESVIAQEKPPEETRDAMAPRAGAATLPLVLHARIVTDTGGGPDKTILNSPRFLRQYGFDSRCLFLRPPGDAGFEVLRQRARCTEAPLVEIEDRGRIDWGAIAETIRYCRQHQVRIWHAHDYKTNLIGLIARRFHPMHLVTTAHGWGEDAGLMRLYYWMEKRFWIPRYDRAVFVSPALADACCRAGTPTDRSRLIENAIDTEQFFRRQPSEVAQATRFGGPPDQLVIGALGRLSPEKGFDRLIDAFVQLRQRGLEARLVIAGEGPERAALERQITASGHADRIELLGFCADTRAFLECLDLFVLSSLREGLPNALLEAMAVEVPVVATCVGGVPRVVRHGINGLLVDPGDGDRLTDAIETLARSPERRRRFAAAGLKTIRTDWSFRRRMEAMVAVYCELLGVP
jgi:glycosyltransferase involved in cell wall biosynthesis